MEHKPQGGFQGRGGRTRGKQVYLGGWLTEEAAATAFDLASIKYWGNNAILNVGGPGLSCPSASNSCGNP